MIKCKVQKGGTIQVKAKGTVSDVSKEFLAIASEIYHGIKRENEPAAEEFRRLYIASAIDPESPVFK